MSNIGDRIYQFIKYLDVSNNHFCKKVGISNPVMLKYYQSGKFEPSFETLNKIKEVYPAISLEWLIYDVGTMLEFDHFEYRFQQYSTNKNLNTDRLSILNFVYEKTDNALAKKLNINRNAYLMYKTKDKELPIEFKNKLVKLFPAIPKSWW
ncbi:helix-turn-helix transcriptional regulator [Riemerella anatipestifer]|nr:helix-turn-helix transcriptional regulator [Riemerella anatipestifer]